jgi:hypothetical protein
MRVFHWDWDCHWHWLSYVGYRTLVDWYWSAVGLMILLQTVISERRRHLPDFLTIDELLAGDIHTLIYPTLSLLSAYSCSRSTDKKTATD